jgi:hypothetical protein
MRGTWRNFRIHGGAYGFVFPNSGYELLRCTWDNVQLSNQTAAGMRFENEIYWGTWHVVQCNNSPVGIEFAAAGNSHINSFDLCSFAGCVVGLDLKRFLFGRIAQCDFEANTHYGLAIAGCSFLNFDTCYFEANCTDDAGGPYADVLLSGSVDSERTWDILFNNTYCGPAGDNQGTPPIFARVTDPDNVNNLNFYNHNLYAKAIDYGDDRGVIFGEAGESRWNIANLDTLYVYDTYKRGPVLTSPDGTRFRIIVGNDGALDTEEVTI